MKHYEKIGDTESADKMRERIAIKEQLPKYANEEKPKEETKPDKKGKK